MNIQVLLIRPLASENGPLKAFVDIQIGDWTIYGWRIVKQEEGQRAWVSVPQATWKDRDGKIKYQALLTIPGELKQQIEVAILSAWEKEKEKNGRQPKRAVQTTFPGEIGGNTQCNS